MIIVRAIRPIAAATLPIKVAGIVAALQDHRAQR
jgi:hypothetical protein